jgi:CRISPR/Cas system-associated endonuclease Cas1
LKPKNVNASHPINAMLNYAYAVKQAQLHIEAIANGFDPTLGIMHSGRRGLPAYIFDQIEPHRPLVDRAMLNFMQRQTFSGSDFVLQENGVCRLSSQLAKMVASLV